MVSKQRRSVWRCIYNYSSSSKLTSCSRKYDIAILTPTIITSSTISVISLSVNVVIISAAMIKSSAKRIYPQNSDLIFLMLCFRFLLWCFCIQENNKIMLCITHQMMINNQIYFILYSIICNTIDIGYYNINKYYSLVGSCPTLVCSRSNHDFTPACSASLFGLTPVLNGKSSGT